jgi:hypothetical protein
MTQLMCPTVRITKASGTFFVETIKLILKKM